jgi:hypothetical protein
MKMLLVHQATEIWTVLHFGTIWLTKVKLVVLGLWVIVKVS